MVPLTGRDTEVPRISVTHMMWQTQIWTILEKFRVLPNTRPPTSSLQPYGGLAWLSLPGECGMPFLLLSSSAGVPRNSRRLQEPSNKMVIWASSLLDPLSPLGRMRLGLNGIWTWQSFPKPSTKEALEKW